MLKRAGSASITYLAYVFLLLAFVLLGVFVAALAHESGFAAVAGAGLVAGGAGLVVAGPTGVGLGWAGLAPPASLGGRGALAAMGEPH